MLDTDIPMNDPADRPITGILYVRGREMRLCQEIVLGMGACARCARSGSPGGMAHERGPRGLPGPPRAAVERCGEGAGSEQALKQVAPNTVFTTHTPVPAGNETFDRELAAAAVGAVDPGVGAEPQARCPGRRPRPVQPDGAGHPPVLQRQRREPSAPRRGGLGMWRSLRPGEPDSRSPTSPTASTPRAGSGRRCARSTRTSADRGSSRSSTARTGAAVQAIPDADLWAAHRAQKERLIRFVREGALLRSRTRATGSRPTSCGAGERLLDPRPSPSGSPAASPPTSAAGAVLPRPGAAAPTAHRPGPAGADHLRRQGPPADRDGQELIRRLFRMSQGEFAGASSSSRTTTWRWGA